MCLLNPSLAVHKAAKVIEHAYHNQSYAHVQASHTSLFLIIRFAKWSNSSQIIVNFSTLSEGLMSVYNLALLKQ